jgi:hypothetical protein
MTELGGKRPRDVVVNTSASPFAPLKPLSRGASMSLPDSLTADRGFANFGTKARIHLVARPKA